MQFFQKISTVENKLPLFDMVNVKGIVYVGALEIALKVTNSIIPKKRY